MTYCKSNRCLRTVPTGWPFAKCPRCWQRKHLGAAQDGLTMIQTSIKSYDANTAAERISEREIDRAVLNGYPVPA